MKCAGVRRLALLAVLAGLALGVQSAGVQSAGAQSAPTDPKPNFSQLRREIQGFESIVNGVVNSTFDAAPFALTQRTKGVYLPGYGAAFTFVVNIHRAIINTPFGDVRRESVTPDEKKRRIETVKERLMRVLFEQSDSMRQLRREDNVAIIAAFEDRNFPDEESQNKTLVLSVARKELEGVAGREDRWGDFKQRIKFIEY